jgi:hypothetical protein
MGQRASESRPAVPYSPFFLVAGETVGIVLLHRPSRRCVNAYAWKWMFFANEKDQVRNDLKQHPSYWKSKEQQALLQCAFEETDRRRSMRRSVARIILGRQFDNYDLVALVTEYL